MRVTDGRLLALSIVLLSACRTQAPAPRRALPAEEVPRVAVLPLRVGGDLDPAATFLPAPEPLEDAGDAGTAVARRLAVALAQTGVDVVDAETVFGVMDMIAPGPYGPALAVRVAERVAANLAVIGAVSRYREREGSAWAAIKPASLEYRVALVRVPDGAVVAMDHFAYTQQALSENLLNLPKFLEAGGRWLTREEMLGGAADATAGRLADAIAGHAPPPRLMPGR